jgi:hypothetical protein
LYLIRPSNGVGHPTLLLALDEDLGQFAACTPRRGKPIYPAYPAP